MTKLKLFAAITTAFVLAAVLWPSAEAASPRNRAKVGYRGRMPSAMVGRPAAVPSQPPQTNLALWLRADRLTYTNSTRTLPATAAGDLVAGWSPLGGTMYGSQGNAATYDPIRRAPAIRGLTSLGYDGIADYMPIVGSSSGLAFIHQTGNFELLVVFRKDTTLRCGLFSSLVSSTDKGFDLEFSTTGALNMILTKGGGVTNGFKTSGTLFSVGQWYAVLVRGDGTNMSLSTDFSTFAAGDTVAFSNLPFGTGDATGNTILGSIGPVGSPTFPFDGQIEEVVCYSSAMSTADRLLLKNYVSNRYGPTLPRPRRMACIGDSITQTAPARANVPWPELLEARLGQNWCVGNYGVSGAQTAATSTLVTNSVVGKGYEESTVLIGVNDCVAGVDDAATIFGRIYNGTTGIVDKLLADGQRVNLCTILPTNNYASSTPTIRTKISAINTLIKALSVTNLTIIDTYDYMGDAVDPTQLSYQGGGGKPDCVTFSDNTRDYLHIGPGGCTRLADCIYYYRSQN